VSVFVSFSRTTTLRVERGSWSQIYDQLNSGGTWMGDGLVVNWFDMVDRYDNKIQCSLPKEERS
jgi:hypothetical protein